MLEILKQAKVVCFLFVIVKTALSYYLWIYDTATIANLEKKYNNKVVYTKIDNKNPEYLL